MTLLNQLIKQMFVLIKYAAKVSNVAGNFMNDREFFIKKKKQAEISSEVELSLCEIKQIFALYFLRAW